MRRRLHHHPNRRRLRGFGYFKRLGPGLVTGASDDDPSGIGTYSQVGARFGFQLLWTAPLSLPLAAAVQEAAGRLGLSSGRGLAALIRERFPRGVLVGAVSLVAVANVFNIGADLGAMAASVRLLVDVPYEPLVILMAVVIVSLEVLLPYHRYARVLRWLTASLLTYLAVLAAVHIHWGDVLRHTFTPDLSLNRAALGALIAIFGTTISPYLFFWQASEEVEEEIEHRETPAVASRHVRVMRLDIVAGMASAVVVMFAIMVASAATLGAHGAVDIQSADQAARALRPLAGQTAQLLFALGILGTGALAVPVLAGSTAYAVTEAVGAPEGLSRRVREAPLFYATVVAATVAGLTLGFVGVNPIRGLYFAAILNGITAPPLILLMLLLSMSRQAVGSLTGGRLSLTLLALAFVVMSALPIAWLVT